jgi:hypothetical protein
MDHSRDPERRILGEDVPYRVLLRVPGRCWSRLRRTSPGLIPQFAASPRAAVCFVMPVTRNLQRAACADSLLAVGQEFGRQGEDWRYVGADHLWSFQHPAAWAFRTCGGLPVRGGCPREALGSDCRFCWSCLSDLSPGRIPLACLGVLSQRPGPGFVRWSAGLCPEGGGEGPPPVGGEGEAGAVGVA